MKTRKVLLNKIKELSNYIPLDIFHEEKFIAGKGTLWIIPRKLKLFSGQDLPTLELKEEEGKFYIENASFWVQNLFISRAKEISENSIVEYLTKKIKWLFPDVEVILIDTENKDKKVIHSVRIEVTVENIQDRLLTLINLILTIDGFLHGLNLNYIEFEITRKDLIETIVSAEYQANDISIDEIANRKEELEKYSIEELVDLLQKKADSYCLFSNKGKLFYDSMALSAYRDVLLLLSKLGKIRIEAYMGRRIIATPIKNLEKN